MAERNEDQQDDGKVEVTLLKNHTHAGVSYKAGDTIRVTPAERDWLADENRKVVAGVSKRNATTVSENTTGARTERSGNAPGLQGQPGTTRDSNPKAR